MIFLCPVEDGVQYILGAHAPLGGQVAAAAGPVGGRAVLLLPVIIPWHCPPQPGIQPVGVVVDHIHNDPKTVPVQGLNSLLHFSDPYGPVDGIGGVRALWDIVVDRIISPVELLRTAALIYGAIIKNRHQLHMSHAQFLQVGKTGGMLSITVQSGVFLAEGLEFSAVFGGNSRGRVPGEVLDVNFVNHRLRRKRRRFVPGPARRIGPGQVEYHTPLAIQAAGAGIRVCCGPGLSIHCDQIVIIKCIQIFWRHKAPKAPVLPVKRKLPQEAFPGSRLVEPERNSLGSGRPQAEGSSLGTAEGTQRNVTMILLLKSKGVKELLSVRHHFDSSSPEIVTL